LGSLKEQPKVPLTEMQLVWPTVLQLAPQWVMHLGWLMVRPMVPQTVSLLAMQMVLPTVQPKVTRWGRPRAPLMEQQRVTHLVMRLGLRWVTQKAWPLDWPRVRSSELRWATQLVLPTVQPLATLLATLLARRLEMQSVQL